MWPQVCDWIVVVQSLTRVRLCDPMDWSTPVSPVLHYLPEFAQIHIHWVSDANQPSHLLSPPSPPALNLSQHWGLFQWTDSSHHAAKLFGASASASVLPMNSQNWFPLGLTTFISCCPRDTEESSPAPQSKASILWPCLWSSSHTCTWILEKP